MLDKIITVLFYIFVSLVLAALVDLVIAGVLQWLWNATLTVTKVPISFWDAFRLLFIVSLLFAGTKATFTDKS